MVSDTRCPALYVCDCKWWLAGQRPRRGRCPVEHRGTLVRLSIRSFVPPLALSSSFCKFPMLFNMNSTFFHFSSISHTIRWEFCTFPLFFNFPCYSIGILWWSTEITHSACYSMETFAFFIFSSIFHVFQWKLLKYSYFVNFPCYSMMQWCSQTQ